MKLEEMVLPDWNKTFRIVANVGESKIILLNLVKMTGIRKEGRKNLVAVDKEDNITWVADLPEADYSAGYFNNFNYRNRKLTGWYGGSILLEIDVRNGKILKEDSVK